MHPLERRILSTLRERALVRPGERGLVLVSGGPDSLALLHLLHAAAEPLALALEVLHFDHGLRPASGDEAAWVAGRAEALGLACHVVRATHLAGLNSGVQAAARDWRLAEGERMRAERGAAWLASGHQRDDQWETWLLKWLRGAHLTHLRGMDWRSGATIRPLLDTPRSELTAYLRQQGEAWLEDPSNRQPRYKRNRVRHELVPLLEALSEGGLARRLADLEGQGRALADWMDTELAARPAPAANDPAQPPHWVDAAGLAALPAPLAAETLYRFVQARLPGTLEHGHVEQALRLLAGPKVAWSVDLPAGRILRRRGSRLLLLHREEARPDAGPAREQRCQGRHITALPGCLLDGEPPAEGAPDADQAPRAALVLHNLPGDARLEVRRRRPGDRFHPPWRERPVRLKDFLRDQGVPLWERERLPVVVWQGRVVAVYPRFVGKGHERPLADAEPSDAPLHLRLRPG